MVEIPAAVMIGLWVAVLIALVFIAFKLRTSPAAGSAEKLQASVELLKADLISRQTESLLSLRQSIDSANQLINERLAEGTTSLDRRMAVLGDIENQLGKLTIQTNHIEAVGKNIQSLSDLLKPPKVRGSIGEMFLENILGQILPAAAYETQYLFADGVRVDAAIRLGEHLLPIDAKFPLEAFERLQKEPENPEMQKQFSQVFRKHIDDIATKYIQPASQTTDFAIMYVPAEAIYYQLISQAHQDGFEYALSKRVVPSSPGHLYAFLASVATLHQELTLLGGELGEGSRRLRAGLDQLLETTGRLDKFHNRMEGSLRGLTAGLDHARSELQKLRLEVEKLRDPFEATAGETRE